MQYKPKLCLLEVLGVMLFGIPHISAGQTLDTCPRPTGEAILDVNNVRARIVNTGGLFWRGAPHIYNVPKRSNSNAIFASSIWFAGKVSGQLRASATLYGEWEMWAGPLDDTGTLPTTNCEIYDRVYKVGRRDIDAFEANGIATSDLADWPTGLGAPTYDANGDLIELLDQPFTSREDRVINLGAGERPAIMGDQSVWWVMNDKGNEHTTTDSPPIGLEVHVMAFAFDVAGDIGNTTFYRYNLHYKGTEPLTEAYFGIYVDPDLGDFSDDYVGSDSLLGIGYVYNSDNFDDGGEGYGSPVPALGYDFVQGPIVSSPGSTALVSGRVVPDFANLQMTTFAFWYSAGGVQGGPVTAEEFYKYMRGFWLDGKRFTQGGDGRNFSSEPTNFVFSGDPSIQGFWTEINSDGLGSAIDPGDRRFAMSTGPFTIEPGDSQEVLFTVVWALGSDNLDSVRALRDADRVAQALADASFERPVPPAAPVLIATEFDSGVTLSWTTELDSNNYLESYREHDPFSRRGDYEFEGYRVLQFSGPEDDSGELLATYDVVNGVTRVLDLVDFRAEPPLDEIKFLSADGSDTGIMHTHTIGGLTNTTSYFYGVQAYAYNKDSAPKIFKGPVARISVIPRRSEDTFSQLAIDAALDDEVPDFIAEANAIGSGGVTADIVNPGAMLENATYVTRFYELEAGRGSRANRVTYDIDRTTGGETTTVFDGSVTGVRAPLRRNVILIDGLQFSVTGPAPGMLGFKMIANTAGVLDPPDMAAFAFNSSGFPLVEGRDRPEGGRNQSTNGSTWGIHVGGGSGAYGDEAGPFDQGLTWVGRSILEGTPDDPWPNVGSDDYEWRFPQSCFDRLDGVITDGECVGWRGIGDGALVELPFELWNTGPTSDPSDDYRMLPLICENLCTDDGNRADFVFDIGGDHQISGGNDDPFSDWVYWYKPQDNGASAGDAGYHAWFFGDGELGDRVFSRQVLVNWNGFRDRDRDGNREFNARLPEPGSVIQYNTKKTNLPGDTYTFNTAGFGATPASDELKKSRLADINVVPNPYLLTSDYERKLFADEVRFSNLPLGEEATIRVFALNGTLVRTLFKPVGVNQLSWDLKTDGSRSIGSGIFLIHVEVPGTGTQVIKFAAIMKRVKINFFE